MSSLVNIDKLDRELKNPAKEFPYKLDEFQKKSIIAIEDGYDVLVVAHTSAGKSTIADYAIAKSIKLGLKSIYTSPIKTLSNQQFSNFIKNYDTGLLTGDHKLNPDADCIVATTEIILNMLYKGDDFLKDIDTLIFDECHYITDEDRGHVWEEIIVMLPKHIQIISLSATVDKPKDFALKIANARDKKISLITTYKRPVPLNHYIYYN